MYEIFATETFRKIYQSLPANEKEWVDTTKENIKESPFGKPLGFPWFREKKFLNKRLYFLIDEQLKRILLVSFASKKDQQQIIDFIKQNMKELLGLLKNI